MPGEPADATLRDEEAAGDVPAPRPGLVTIGSTEAGELLLLNQAQLPALLDGNPAHVTAVCTSLALRWVTARPGRCPVFTGE